MTSAQTDLDQLIDAVRRRAGASPLDRVGTAVAVADELARSGDRLVTHYVTAAREAGCSWAQIGGQLGVSKQAAQQGFVASARSRRFGRRRPAAGDPDGWTDSTRRAVKTAQEEARLLGHPCIGTEHLLLGVLAQGGPAGAVLQGRGIDADAVRRRLPPGGGTARSGHLPVSRRAQKVLDLAVREAVRMSQDGVGPEHVLLGIIREGEGLAAQILVALGADLAGLRLAVEKAAAPAGQH